MGAHIYIYIYIYIYIHTYIFLFLFLFLFFAFQGHTRSIWRVPGQAGVQLELQLIATPQTRQHQIQAASVTYTTAHGNAVYLTHWARPGIKPASQCSRDTADAIAPQQELPDLLFLKAFIRSHGKWIARKWINN